MLLNHVETAEIVFIVKKNINFILNIVKTENLKNYYLVLKNICIYKI